MILNSSLQFAVIPILIGPLQILLAALPALLIALISLITALMKPRIMMGVLRVLWRQKWVLAAVILLVSGVRYVFIRAGARNMLSTAQVQGREWPQARGSVLRQGRVPGEQGPDRGGTVWVRHDDSKESFLSSPAVSAGRIYVSSARMGILKGKGLIYCLDSKTGAVIWRNAPPDYEPTFSSPVCSEDYLLCGEGLHKTKNARLVCLDLRPGREGDVVWTLQTASHVECTPVIADGRVVVGAGDDGYYCVKLDDGEDGRPHVLWHLPGDKYPDAETALAVHDGLVYAGLGVGGEALCVLDLATGKEIKRLATPYPVFTEPAVFKDRIYIGMGNGNLVESAEDIRAAELQRLRKAGASEDEIEQARERLRDGGEVWCIDSKSLEVIWRYKCGSTVLASISVSEDSVVFVTRSGQLNVLNHSGQLVRDAELGGTVLGAPAMDDETVYVLTAGGKLHALTKAGLNSRWTQQLSGGSVNTSSPVLDGGRVYVGTEKAGVFCVGSRRGTGKRVWNGEIAPMSSGPGETGDYAWNFPPEMDGGSGEAWVEAEPLISAGGIYVPFSRGRPGVTCLSRDDKPAVLWHAAAPGGVMVSPVATEDFVFFLESAQSGDGKAMLRAVSAVDGRSIWARATAGSGSGSMMVSTQLIVVAEGPAGLSCWSHEGAPLWALHKIGSIAGRPFIKDQLLFAATVNPDALLVLDLATGATIWKKDAGSTALSGPVLEGERVLFDTVKGLSIHDLYSGSLTSLLPWPGPGRGGVLLAQGRVLRRSDDGLLQMLDTVSGQTIVGPALAEGTVPLLFEDGRAMIWGKVGIDIASVKGDGAATKRWCDTDWLGLPSTPMVVDGDRVYAGVRGWGLVCFKGVE